MRMPSHAHRTKEIYAQCDPRPRASAAPSLALARTREADAAHLREWMSWRNVFSHDVFMGFTGRDELWVEPVSAGASG